MNGQFITQVIREFQVIEFNIWNLIIMVICGGQHRGGYIFKFNGSNWVCYTGCFDPIVYSLTFESSREQMSFRRGAIPQGEGLAKFDNQWTNYQTNNSALPEDYLHKVETDVYDNVWVGSWKFGLGIFQDSVWLPVNTSGSGLSCNWVKKRIITDWNGFSYILTYYNGVSTYDWYGYLAGI